MTEQAAQTGPSEDAVSAAVQVAESIAGRPDDSSQEPAAEPQAPADTVELPSLADITKVASERAAARAAAEAQLAPVREMLTPLQQQIEQLRSTPDLFEQLRTDPAAALKAAGHDPAKVREMLQDQPADPVAALERIIDEKLAPLRDMMAPAKPAAPQAPPVDEAKAVFSEYVQGAATDFPNLSALPPSYVGAMALDYVQRAHAAGHQTSTWTDQQIAAAVERELASGRTQSINGAATTTPPPSPGTPVAANGGSTPSSTRSITNGLAADGSRRPPKTAQERFADAVAFVENRGL